MENISAEKIESILVAQRAFFATGATLDYNFRREQLKRLTAALKKWEKPLCEAIWHDLHKSNEEFFLTELSIVYGEIRNHLAHLKSWMKPQRCATPLKMFPSHSRVVTEPLGTALIVAPWNYPVHLLLNPLVGAISAGCTAVLKPSPYVPHVSQTLQQMINEFFPENYIAIVQGNREVNAQLFAQRFDLIFFTGSPSLGKQVMQAAAQHLTPVILELGGKSPCIVDKSANVKIAAKRIAWGKTMNAGQTCVAPDYLLIHRSQKEAFIKAFRKALHDLHGDDIKKSRYFVRMVNERAFERVKGYLSNGTIVLGGSTDADDRYIEPTLIDDVSPNAPVMQEEIFGPVLPMITFDHAQEAIDFVTKREKPLAFYYFGNVREGYRFIKMTSSGGGCINDTLLHLANERMPFGGVGNSGMGHYHGHESFLAFSHRRALVVTPTCIDVPFRYMPYKLFRWVKRLL